MITNTFGTLEIGSSFTIFLFGIVTLQTYLYYSHFHEDPLVVKALVHSAHVLILSLGTKLSKLIHRSAWFGLVPGVACEIYRMMTTLYAWPDLIHTLPGFGILIILGGWITMLVQV